MKRNLIYLLTALIVSTFSMLSCSKDKESDEPDNPNKVEDSSQPSTPASNDQQIKELIQKHVSASVIYQDFVYNIHIESTLQTALPNATIEYGIGHGDIDGIMKVSVENQAFKFSSYKTGNTRILDFVNPFWFYWVMGVEENYVTKEKFTITEMYYASFMALKNKPTNEWSVDEIDVFPKLKRYLQEDEREIKYLYTPSIELEINGKFYHYASYPLYSFL